MLAPPDAAVAARDPVVPGLRVVLDPEAVADRLRVLLEPPIRVVPSYVRYKPGSSCLVGYRVECRGGDQLIHVKAFKHGKQSKLAKMTTSPAGTAAFEDDLVGIAVFPQDRLLPVVGRLSDPVFFDTLLSRILPDGLEWQGAHLHMIRYKPERRYVARIDLAGRPVAALKAYCPDDYLRAAKIAKVATGGRQSVRTPLRLGASDRHRVVAHEWLAGSQLEATASMEVMEAVGNTLAVLHRRPKKHLARRRRREEASAIRESGRSLAELVPELQGRLKRLSTEVARRVREMEPRKIPIHGDFSPDQIVLGPFGVGVLDLDNAVLADPAADVGWFAADLEMRALGGDLFPSSSEGAIAALVAGYRDAGGEDLGERLPAYRAASLLSRAVEPFRYRSASWPQDIESVVRRAEEVWPG